MSLLSFEQALEHLLAAARAVGEVETLPLTATAGRVLAVAQYSPIAVPAQHSSMMDGYAVRFADLGVAGTRLPISQRIPAGSVGTPLLAGTAARIFTGAPLPAGADAVVMQELCERDDGGVVINQLPRAGENVRRAGQDIALGAEILPAGIRLRPQDVALAASAGLPELPVCCRLRVGVFFTGDELTQPGEALAPGGIYNSNRYGLRALLEGLGCAVSDFGIVPDNLAATRAALRRAAVDNDLIITSGGVSVGEEDHVKPAVEAEGCLKMWKVALKPGKPLAFGEVRRANGGHAWFIGLPGNPVSGMVSFLMLVLPFLRRLQGVADVAARSLPLRAAFDWSKPDVRAEFLRARVNAAGEVELYPDQGASVLSSLCWATGLVLNPPGKSVCRGDIVRFVPFAELLA